MNAPKRAVRPILATAAALSLLSIVLFSLRRARLDEAAKIGRAPTTHVTGSGANGLSGAASAARSAQSSATLDRSDLSTLFGFVPYQDTGTLAALGITSKDDQDRANRLFGDTFFTLVDELAKHADIQVNQPERVVMVCALDQPTKDRLRAQFYAGLKDIIGTERFGELTSNGPIELLETGMLGFGDFPVVVDIQSKAEVGLRTSVVCMTMGTQSRAAIDPNATAAYSKTQTFPVTLFEKYFASLKTAANRTAFQWPSGS